MLRLTATNRCGDARRSEETSGGLLVLPVAWLRYRPAPARNHPFEFRTLPDLASV